MNYFSAKMNKYVDVTFESSTRVVCTFTEQPGSQNKKSCGIMYGSCGQQLTVTVLGRSTSASTVVIDFPELQSSDYCYIIRASNGTYTVQVQGMFSKYNYFMDILIFKTTLLTIHTTYRW